MLHQIYYGDKVKEDKMGGACSTHRDWEMHTKLWSKNLKGRDHMENLGVDEKVILEWILWK
jgi:hypothetical protein